jgi:hypothetical protein
MGIEYAFDEPGFEHDEGDALLSSATKFLMDGNERDAAVVLASCTLEDPRSFDDMRGEWFYRQDVTLRLRGPRLAFEVLNDTDHPIAQAVYRALSAVLPHGHFVAELSVRAELITPDHTWREELMRISRAAVSRDAAEGNPLIAQVLALPPGSDRFDADQ